MLTSFATYQQLRPIQRLDPRGCGCTDCLTGYARPITEASDALLLAAARGEIINASGQTLQTISNVISD